jgi:Tfp pilus assembly protein PilF
MLPAGMGGLVVNHKIISAMSAIIIVIFLPAITSAVSPGNRTAVKAETGETAAGVKTIAHDFLDMENNYGAGARHYRILESLLNRSHSIVEPMNNPSTEDAVRLMLAIDHLLKSEGFGFKQNYLLSTGLETRSIDCDNYCALYIAIAELHAIPILPVYAPNHSFLRFIFDDGSYLNWEPLEARPLPDAHYIEKLSIARESIARGVYLKSLSRKEFIAVERNNIGAWLMTRRDYAGAVAHFDAAVAQYPQFSSAWHNRGSCWYALKKADRAEADLKKAASLDPSRASTRNTLGDIYFDRRDYENAVKEYAASIKLDPSNYVPCYSLGLVMKALGNNGESRKWLQRAEELKRGEPQ